MIDPYPEPEGFSRGSGRPPRGDARSSPRPAPSTEGPRGVPKALMAVPHRFAFVIYGIWKSGKAYDEGTPDSFDRKRERRKERAEAQIEPVTRATPIEKG